MNSRGILDFRLASDISNSDEVETTLNAILETLECMQKNGTPICYADAFYDQVIFDKEFSNWLYDLNSQPELSTLKKEFATRINRSVCISLDECTCLIDAVDQNNCQNELVMSVRCSTENVLYVDSPARYWRAKQWYLALYVKHQDFSTDIIECFPNLYFHEDVAASLNTLNANFTIERPYIVQHLQALNDFKPQFSALNDAGSDYRRTCAEFQAYSHIECSPQSDRQAAQKLNYKFCDSKGKEVVVCCELHTKLKWDGMDKLNQDRIYFHPGKPEIADGKVLIVHIGTHQ